MQGFGESSKRIRELRNTFLEQPCRICTERAKIVTHAYKKYEDQPIVMKRSLAFKDILEQMTIIIVDNDLLAGYQSSMLRAAPIFPEYSIQWVLNELDEFEKRPGDVFHISEAQKQDIRDIYPFWEKKTLQARALTLIPKETKLLNDIGVIRAENTMTTGDGHIAVNFEKLLKIGIRGFQEQTKAALEKLGIAWYGDLRKHTFLSAVSVALDAVVTFARRNADFLNHAAETTKEPARKKELCEMAEICNRVPEYPARNFREGRSGHMDDPIAAPNRKQWTFRFVRASRPVSLSSVSEGYQFRCHYGRSGL